jgi:hypothetical protein
MSNILTKATVLVLNRNWQASPVTKQNRDRAWSQLGTSGSGNHFVEFGLFTAHGEIHGLEAGSYARVQGPEYEKRMVSSMHPELAALTAGRLVLAELDRLGQSASNSTHTALTS